MPAERAGRAQRAPRDDPPAAQYLARELLRLLASQSRHLAGVCAGDDPDALHDFRVALRRSRSIFRQVRRVFPQRDVAMLSPHFAWLSHATSRCRDLDVLQHWLSRSTPADAAVAHLLGRWRAAAQGDLIRALESHRYLLFTRTWRALLERVEARGARTADGREPASRVGARTLRRLVDRALRECGVIDSSSPMEELHTLRKTCKKLRYVLEAFEHVLPARRCAVALAQLKALQDELGRLCDCDARLSLVVSLQGSDDLSGTAVLERLCSRLEADARRLRRGLPRHIARFERAAAGRSWQLLTGVRPA